MPEKTTLTSKMIEAWDDDDWEDFSSRVISGDADAPRMISGFDPVFWIDNRRVWKAWRHWANGHQAVIARQRRIWLSSKGIAPAAFESSPTQPDRRGLRGAGAGRASVVTEPPVWQSATSLASGFGVNYVDAPAPAVGMPLGRSIFTGKEIGFDCFAWYEQGLLSGNPSCFVMSLPGLGKSTMQRKIMTNHAAQGHINIVAGDSKGEYLGWTTAMVGQIVQLGHGLGTLNPLEAGALGAIIPRLADALADALGELVELAHELNTLRDQITAAGQNRPSKRLLNARDALAYQCDERAKRIVTLENYIVSTEEQVHARQLHMVSMLLALGRQDRIADFENMVMSMALRELYTDERYDFTWELPPTLPSMIDHIEQGSDSLKAALQTESREAYVERITPLLLSLRSMLDGATGTIFSGQTSTPLDLDAPAICIDISSVDRSDKALKAAVIMACWSQSFGAVEAAHTLADVGLDKQKYFALTLDEMWAVIGAAPGLIGEIDALTRLNRTEGLSLYMITHSFQDLLAVANEEDRTTAIGFIERAGAIICGGLPRAEMERVADIIHFKEAEISLVSSWSKGVTPKRSRAAHAPTPPGRGHFLIKPSKAGESGIAFATELTPYERELDIHNTNKRFDAMFEKVKGDGSETEDLQEVPA